MIDKPMLRNCLIGVFLLLAGAAHAHGSTPAKKLFGDKPLPASLTPRAVGFYSRGCLAGGAAMPVNGPTWQTMRLSRNRNWGHPDLIAYLKWLAGQAAAKDGWPGLLVGDMSQPRGGPMLTGHLSHQTGLDADIWLTPMPNRRLSRKAREQLSATAIVKPGPHTVYSNVWTEAHFRLIKRAASHKRVQRILVAPGIKKKLCESEKGDRRWLRKIRPYYGHNYHMHIRLFCPPGSAGCKAQNATPADDGCGKALAWWYSKAPYAKAKPPPKTPPKPRKEITLAGLPAACRKVLSAADRTDSGPAPAAYSGKSLPMEGSAPLSAMAPAASLTDLPVPVVPRSRPAGR